MMFLGKCGLQLIQNSPFFDSMFELQKDVFHVYLSSTSNGEGTSICVIEAFQRTNIVQSLDNLNLSQLHVDSTNNSTVTNI